MPLIPKGMVLAIENEPSTGLASLSDVDRLCESFGHDQRLGAIWDPGNYVYDCSAMNTFDNIGVILDQVLGDETVKLKIVAAVHVKECRNALVSLVAETVALSGEYISWEDFLGDVDMSDYDGPVDLEPHRSAVGQLTEASRAMPGGEGYGNPKACTEDWQTLSKYRSGLN